MAKALFFSLPQTGHVNPSLTLVRELVTRGDEVIYYATDRYAKQVEETGARYREYRNAYLEEMRGLPERLHELSSLLTRTTGEILEEHLEEFRVAQPDYLICDAVAPWGQWVGELLGLPVVTSVPTFVFNRKVAGYAAKRGVRPKSAGVFFSKLQHIARGIRLVRQLQRRYGVKGPGLASLVMAYSDLNLVYTSRKFQPCSETFDGRYVFVGPMFRDRVEAKNFPWSEVRRPTIVYVALGTLFNADTAFYRSCFEAFLQEDVQVIMSIGSSVTPESLGTPPANFIVRPHVPQLEVLKRTAVFVTHGGMNSVNESISCGVPIVVVPQMSEQEVVGIRVAELGAGLAISKESVTAESLRNAVREVLGNPRFAQKTAAIGESFAAAGGAARAADSIKAYLGTRAKAARAR